MAKTNAQQKRNRFKTVAAKRVQKVLDSLESLSKCANRGNYDYTEEEVGKMMKAIKDKVRLLDLSFTGGKGGKKEIFEF